MANPLAIEKTERLLQELRDDDGSPARKASLLRQVEEIRTSLQTPPEIADFYIKKGLILIIINTCLELGVFDAVSPDAPASADAIAAKVGIDASILSRFLRALIIEGFFTLVPSESPSPTTTPSLDRPILYAHTPSSLALRSPATHAWWGAALTMAIHRLWRAPEYLRSHTLVETRDPRRNGLAWGMGLAEERLTFFEALERDKEYARFWKLAMESVQFGPGSFPWGELKGQVEREPDRVVVVDVGGGRGKALAEIKSVCERHEFGGEMVLEDLEAMLGGESPVRIEGVTNLVYDFFAEGAEQPVKDAHVYYLRRVLHDYYDDHARSILKQVVDAMGFTSRIVLCEYVMPEHDNLGDDIFPYLMDFLLFMGGGLERTEAQWRVLLDSVGLEIVKVWRSSVVPIEADIEVRLKGYKETALA